MEVVSRVNIDLARKGVNPIVYAVQNDENTRKIVVSLFCNGIKFDVAEDVFAVIGYSKPDGTKGIYDVLSNGYPAFKIAGNTVEITLAAQALTIPGKVVIVIALLDQNENQLGIFPIDVLVSEDPGANAINSEDYINLTKTIGLIVEKELEKAKESGEFDGADGKDGKSAYETAKDGGYKGTEAEFADKLAQEIPSALPNPHALTINGKTYDGSESVEIIVTGGTAAPGETETVLSDNLFDKSTATTGKMFYHSNSGFSVIDSIDPGTGMVGFIAYVPLRGAGVYRTVIWWAMHGNYATNVTILKEDKSFLQNATGTLTKIDSTFGYLEFEVTPSMIANGAAIYAFDGMANQATYDIHNVMIVKDREYPARYIPYGYIEVEVDSGKVSDKLDNILRDKTAVFLGDSICAGTTTLASDKEYGWGWGGIIGEANKMVWKNYGRNGGTITPITNDRVWESLWLPYQADLAATEYPNADYVIFEGGCNDADNLGVNGLGTLDPMNYTPTDDSNFTGAFETLVLKLLTKFPKAKIGYIVTHKMGVTADARNRYRAFYDRAVEVCAKWGIPVLDLWNASFINPSLNICFDSSLSREEANEAGKFMADGQHLTLAGYKAIAPQIEAFMRDMNTVAGKDGKDGASGKDGTSVTVKSVSESTADGGSNVVTFSDGKTVTIKNGTKGSTGAAGKNGADGKDYVLTDADKTEIAQQAAALVPSGGVTSWNDLTDRPFGDMVEVFPETAFQYVESLGVFVSPDTFPLVVGYDYVVRWNGVDYPCTAINSIFNDYPCVMVGNPGALGGENNGLPFAVGYMQNALAAVPLDGSTSVTVGILAPKKLHEQYMPTYVYETQFNKFESALGHFSYFEANLPIALLEAAIQQKPIYMKMYGVNDDGSYDGLECFGVASVAGNPDKMRIGLSVADKTSEIFKVPEGTVIDGKEVTTAQMIFHMALRIGARLNYYVNRADDFSVWFIDNTVLD